MDEVRKMAHAEPSGEIAVSFGVTRGKHSVLLSPIYMVVFVAKMTFLKAQDRVDCTAHKPFKPWQHSKEDVYCLVR